MMSLKRKIGISDDLISCSSKSLRLRSTQHRKGSSQFSGSMTENRSSFEKVVSKAGFVLNSGNEPNALKCDQAIFKRDLRKSLRCDASNSLEDNVNQFISGLDKHISNNTRLKWCLIYTQTSGDCESVRRGNQDSLFRILLNIDELQPGLVRLLTEKLIEVAYSDESHGHSDISRLILANLQWLDHIVDSKGITKVIMDLLEGAPVQMQKEVIPFVPNIVEDANHPKISELLCTLYDTTPELIPFILDVLPHMVLEKESLAKVHHSVLKTLPSAPQQHLPIIMKFLVHNTPQASAVQVLTDIRTTISLPGEEGEELTAGRDTPRKTLSKSQSCKKEEETDTKLLIFSNIRTAVLVHKYLPCAWLKAIDEEDTAKGFRPFDLLLLFMLYVSVPTRKRTVESIIRNKIRRGVLSESVIQTTLSIHASLIKEYFDGVKKLSSVLLRSSEPAVIHIGSLFYRNGFMHLDGYYQQEIVLSILAHLGDNDVTKEATLSLLVELGHAQTAPMSRYSIFLKGSLDLLDLLKLKEVKKLLDVLSLVAHFESGNSALQDELTILIRKQLSHSDLRYKRIGVLSAVLSMKNIVHFSRENSTTEEELSDAFSDNSTFEEAKHLFILVQESTQKCPVASALFMDEIALTILRDGMHQKLERWIDEKIINDFQTMFVLDYTEDSQPSEDVIPISAQYNLETEEVSIVLNLAPLAIMAEKNRKDGQTDPGSPLVVLMPHFRLIRMLESRLCSGDLSNIDALLGCPVYAPEASVIAKFPSLSKTEQHCILSCLFYTVNWFRELLNAFATQKDQDLKKKVHQRLGQVIDLQEQLSKLLPLCPSYIPYPAVFDMDPETPDPTIAVAGGSKKVKGGRKASKKKRRKNAGNEGMTSPSQAPSQTQNVSQAKEIADDEPWLCNLENYKPFLREFHMDVFVLLFRNILLDEEAESQGQLTLREAEFLLSDLQTKFSHKLEGGPKRMLIGKATEKGFGCSYLDLFTPAEIALQATRFIKPICVYLEKIGAFFQSLTAVDDEGDCVFDAALLVSKKTAPMMKISMLLFMCLSSILGWSGLKLEENSSILKNILCVISRKAKAQEDEADSEQMVAIAIAFGYFSQFHETMYSMPTAVALVHTLEALYKLADCDDELGHKCVTVVGSLLRKEWLVVGGAKDRGSVYNKNIAYLLKVYFSLSSKPMTGVSEIAEALTEFGLDENKDAISEAFPTLDKMTLPTFYKSLLEHLVICMKKQVSSRSNTSCGDELCLSDWAAALKVFHSLVDMLKKYDSRVLLGHCLKFSRPFLEFFLRSCMPLLDLCFHEHSENVVVLLKNLQTITRPLQHVCTHSKVTQDTSLTRHVPLVRRSLETVVFRVKATFAMNQCHDAFWMGNLKNRNLQGEEIISQDGEAKEDDNNHTNSEVNRLLEEDEEGEDLDEEENQSDIDLDSEEDVAKKSRKRKNSESDNDCDEGNDRTDYSDSF